MINMAASVYSKFCVIVGIDVQILKHLKWMLIWQNVPR